MKISLFRYLDTTWEQARGYLNEDLLHIQTAINRWNGQTFDASNQLLGGTIQGDITKVPQYVSNEGLAKDGKTPAPKWALVDLIAGVKNRLQFVHFVAATLPAVLVGRRSGSPAGDMEQVTLGPGLTMSSSAVLDTNSAGAASAGLPGVMFLMGASTRSTKPVPIPLHAFLTMGG
jgi:hypothetical protein